MKNLLSRFTGPVVLAWGLTMLTAALPACLSPGSRGVSFKKEKGRPSLRDIEEFFVGPGVLQYFLLPQRLQSPSKAYAELDLVVRDSASRPLWGLLHVSFVGSQTLTAADTVLLQTTGAPLLLPPGRLLFAEPHDKQQLTRLEWRLTPAQVAAYLNAPVPAIWVRPAAGPGRMRYEPTKKALKRFAPFRDLTVGLLPVTGA